MHQEEEKLINEQEKLRRRLTRAERCYMKKKEIYRRMMEAGFLVEELMNEIVAENKELIRRVKELQQKLTDLKKRRERGDEAEEAQREKLLLEEEQRKLVKDQIFYMRKMEKEIQKLREQNQHLTAEVNQLSLGKKYKDHLEIMRTVEQMLQHELEKIQEVLCSKDDEIKKKFMILVESLDEIEENLNNVETLRQEQQELREQLRRTQEEHILAAQSSLEGPISQKRQPTDKKDKEHQDGKTRSWLRRGAAGLWKGVKISGLTTLGVSMSVGLIAWMAPVCNHPDPDCNFWNMAFDLMDPYDKFKSKQPPLF